MKALVGIFISLIVLCGVLLMMGSTSHASAQPTNLVPSILPTLSLPQVPNLPLVKPSPTPDKTKNPISLSPLPIKTKGLLPTKNPIVPIITKTKVKRVKVPEPIPGPTVTRIVVQHKVRVVKVPSGGETKQQIRHEIIKKAKPKIIHKTQQKDIIHEHGREVKIGLLAGLTGVVVTLIGTGIVYWWARRAGKKEGEARDNEFLVDLKQEIHRKE